MLSAHRSIFYLGTGFYFLAPVLMTKEPSLHFGSSIQGKFQNIWQGLNFSRQNRKHSVHWHSCHAYGIYVSRELFKFIGVRFPWQTPRIRIFREKQTVAQQVKKFSALRGTRSSLSCLQDGAEKSSQGLVPSCFVVQFYINAQFRFVVLLSKT
jgi:hypothetical protein